MKNGRFVRTTALAVVALGVAAPAAGAATAGPGDNGKVVRMVPGESLTIKLKPGDSASSGYHWRISRQPKNSALRLTSNRAMRHGRVQTIVYRARRPGGGPVLLKYVPPGRKGKPVKTFRLTALVDEREPRLDCNASGRAAQATLLLRGNAAVVFKVRRSLYAIEFGKPVKEAYDAFYGCELSQQRAYRLGGIVDLLNPHEFSAFTLNGSEVAYIHRKGFCPYDQQFTECGPSLPTIESQNLHTGKRIRRVNIGFSTIPENSNPVTGIVLSPAGGLAWIEKSESPDNKKENFVLRSDGPAASDKPVDPEILDRGEFVDENSLRADGSDVTWVNGGRPKRAPLR